MEEHQEALQSGREQFSVAVMILTKRLYSYIAVLVEKLTLFSATLVT